MPRTEAQRASRRRRRERQRLSGMNEVVVVECDYCGNPAECVTGADVYPHRPDLADKIIWECKPCEARVGCHPKTVKPLGRLANEQLRILKMQAHSKFDPIWKMGNMKRKSAYAWLAKELEIDASLCHIGMMNEVMCERVIEVCNEYNRSNTA